MTLRQTGYTQEITDGAGTRQTGQDWTFNDRGLIASEGLDLGDQSWLRSFRYDARGYLTRSEDADQLATYSYTSAGLPKQITDEEGTRTVNRGQLRQLTVDGLVCTWDASGRVIQRGPTTFDYGPDGNLAVARAANRTLVYHYDADGNRLLKYQDGLPVAGYIDGGYLTETGFLAPVKIGGRLVGVLDHGELQLLATDSRGTVLADQDGTPRLASPYGVRATRPDLAVSMDYVERRMTRTWLASVWGGATTTLFWVNFGRRTHCFWRLSKSARRARSTAIFSATLGTIRSPLSTPQAWNLLL